MLLEKYNHGFAALPSPPRTYGSVDISVIVANHLTLTGAEKHGHVEINSTVRDGKLHPEDSWGVSFTILNLCLLNEKVSKLRSNDPSDRPAQSLLLGKGY